MKLGIKMVCFDLNKTLIEENTWYELNQAMGMTEDEDQKLFDLFTIGKLSYVDWQKELERIYIERGKATRENIEGIVFNYSYVKGAREIVNYLKYQGYIVSIISGSIDMLVDRVVKELEVDCGEANNFFEFDDNGYLSRLVCLGEDTVTKVKLLEKICKKLGIDTTETVCIGDGDNDKDIFKATGHGITFKDSKIEKYAWKVIDSIDDIKAIL